jgi:hypothetical protein
MTHQDNMSDMVAAGRAAIPWGTKLSDADVTSIFGLYMLGWKQQDIANQFGVTLWTVNQILNAKSRLSAVDNELDRDLERPLGA